MSVRIISRSMEACLSGSRSIRGARLTVLVLASTLAACATNSRYIMPPSPSPPPVDPSQVEAVVYLIGDAGEPKPEEARVLGRLAEDATRMKGLEHRARIVYLGDNVYEEGFPTDRDSDDYASARARLDPQIRAASSSGSIALFTPGNHDWENKGPRGWEAIVLQTRYVEQNGAIMIPRMGCPGPVVHRIGDRVSLIFLDTQWWLHENLKPGDPGLDVECRAFEPNEVLDGLRRELAESREADRQVIVAAHHPLQTGGRHGGNWTVGDHFLLPGKAKWYHTIPALLAAGVGVATGQVWLVGLGAAAQVAPPLGHIYGRSVITSEHQDLTDPVYQAMRDSLRAAFRSNPPIAYAAGHDHSLQVHRGAVERYSLVSGAGSPDKVTAAKVLDSTVCKVASPGYMRLEFLRGEARDVVLTIVAASEDGDGFDETCRMYLRSESNVAETDADSSPESNP